MNSAELQDFEEQALRELSLIEQGLSTLESDCAWGTSVWVNFKSSNGWRFCVFEDAGGWDYLEWAQAPNGRRWDFGDGWQRGQESQAPSEALMNWRPDHEDRWTNCPWSQARGSW